MMMTQPKSGSSFNDLLGPQDWFMGRYLSSSTSKDEPPQDWFTGRPVSSSKDELLGPQDWFIGRHLLNLGLVSTDDPNLKERLSQDQALIRNYVLQRTVHSNYLSLDKQHY